MQPTMLKAWHLQFSSQGALLVRIGPRSKWQGFAFAAGRSLLAGANNYCQDVIFLWPPYRYIILCRTFNMAFCMMKVSRWSEPLSLPEGRTLATWFTPILSASEVCKQVLFFDSCNYEAQGAAWFASIMLLEDGNFYCASGMISWPFTSWYNNDRNVKLHHNQEKSYLRCQLLLGWYNLLLQRQTAALHLCCVSLQHTISAHEG